MYKRSEANTNDAYDYENRSKRGKNQNQYQTEASGVDTEVDGSLERYINDEKFIKILRDKGIKSLFKIQSKCFRPIYQGYDIIARDRTGSGKTLAFTLPVLQRFRQTKFQHKNPRFLIILPTRQLAIQVHNEIQSLRFRQDDFQSLAIYGKTSIQDNIRKLKKGVDILVATPGRLNDLVERGAVKLDSIQVICLDQADQILKQGFKQQIQKVFSQIKKVNKKKIQTLLFSATIPEWLRQLSNQYQSKNTPYINMISDDQVRTSKQIKHYALQISRLGQAQVAELIEVMVEKYGGFEKRILIFCQKKVDVDGLSRQLRIKNQALHGDIAQFKRQKAYHSFKNGSLRCIVATNVAARGLDFPSVDLVIQMCPPLNTEEYIHRAGRTGRAGKQGTCLTFYDRTRSRLISKIESQARIQIQQVKFDPTKTRHDPNKNSSRDREHNDDRNFQSNSYPNHADKYQKQKERNPSDSHQDPRNSYQRKDSYERTDQNQKKPYQRNHHYKREQKGQRSFSNGNSSKNYRSNSKSRSKSPRKQSNDNNGKERGFSHSKSRSFSRQKQQDRYEQVSKNKDYSHNNQKEQHNNKKQSKPAPTQDFDY